MLCVPFLVGNNADAAAFPAVYMVCSEGPIADAEHLDLKCRPC